MLMQIRIKSTSDHTESWGLLSEGKVDAWVSDDVLLAAYRATAAKPDNYVLSERFLTIEPYGFVMRANDKDLKAIVDGELKRMMRSGEYTKLYDEWFVNTIPGRKINLKLRMNELMRAQVAMPTEEMPTLY